MSKKNFMSYGDAETILTEYAQGVKDVKNPQFTEAGTRNNIASGESYKTIFGKIKKFFSDLKTVAFTGSYNDLSNTPDLSLKANKTDIDDVYKVMGRNGAKNLLNVGNEIHTQYVSGVDIMFGGYGDITLDGTAQDDITYVLDTDLGNRLNVFEHYIVSAGETMDGSMSTYYLSVQEVNEGSVTSSLADVTKDEVEFSKGSVRNIRCVLVIKAGTRLDWVSINPMVRYALDTDDTFQSYAKTNRQLTDDMAIPKYDVANRREYYEGGAAFDGNIDSTPTAGSNNAVASGGTKTYVDNLVSPKINKTSIQSSKAAFPPAAVGVQTVTVTFPTAFAHTPQVMVSWDDNQSLPSFFKYPLHIAGITTTGFTVQAERLNESANWWFRYIAVDNQ